MQLSSYHYDQALRSVPKLANSAQDAGLFLLFLLWKEQKQKHQQKVPDEPGKNSGLENFSNWQSAHDGLDKSGAVPTSCTRI